MKCAICHLPTKKPHTKADCILALLARVDRLTCIVNEILETLEKDGNFPRAVPAIKKEMEKE